MPARCRRAPAPAADASSQLAASGFAARARAVPAETPITAPGPGVAGLHMGQRLGARVIGTVGSPEKLEIARRNGCDAVIDYGAQDFAAAVRELTQGRLRDVVYDGVGRSTATGSLDCLRPRGMFVSHGNASGPVENLGMLDLGRRGSRYATRPMMFHHAASRQAAW